MPFFLFLKIFLRNVFIIFVNNQVMVQEDAEELEGDLEP